MLNRRTLLGTAAAILLLDTASAGINNPGGARTPITSVFAETDIATGFFGFFDTTTNAAHRVFFEQATTNMNSSDWSGTITGTDCQMRGGGSTAPFSVSVDNGAWVTPTIFSGSSSDGMIHVFAGLTDAPHTVRVRAAITGSAFTFAAGTVFSVTGVSPGISFLSTGPKVMITDPTFVGQHLVALAARPAGANVLPANSDTSYGTAGWTYGASVNFRAKCSSIMLFTGDTEAVVFIDGAAQPKTMMIDQTNLGKYRAWRTAISGLDGTTFHNYCITLGTVPNGGSSFGACLGIMLDAGGSFTTTTALKKWVQYGDSITAANEVVSACVNEDGDLYKTGAALGFLGVMSGQTGKTAAQLDTNMAYIRGQRNIVEEVSIIAIGENDALTTSAAFKVSVTNIMNTLVSAGVGTILVRGTAFGGGSAGQPARDTDLAAAVAALANPSVHFIGVTSWSGIQGVTPNDPPSDGVHPTAPGYLTMSGYEVTAYAPYV